jgi:hypothetical protein
MECKEEHMYGRWSLWEMGESAYRATWTRIVSDSLQTGSSTQKINSRVSQQPVRHFNETYGTEFKMKADAYQGVGQHVQHRDASTRTVHTFPCSGMNTHRGPKNVCRPRKRWTPTSMERTCMDGLYIVASADGDK